MGKRAAPKPAGGDQKRLSNASSKSDVSAQIPADVAATFVMHPWMNKVLEKFDQHWKTHQDVVAILESYFPSDPDQLPWGQWLATTFPLDPKVDYIDDSEEYKTTPGRVYLRPYMLSWRRETGNKGWVTFENFRALLQMIMAKGFLTNPEAPGVEMPVCSRHHPKLVSCDMYQPDIEDEVLPANSISMVKGWTRACAMHLLLKLCIEIEVFDQFMSFLGDRAEGFKTIHANFQLCVGDADPMDVNRGTCSLLKKNVQIVVASHVPTFLVFTPEISLSLST